MELALKAKMRLSSRSKLIGLSAVFALPAPLLAQTAPAGQSIPAGTPAAAPSAAMQDIVVTARRKNESIQSVPVSVTAFSRKALQEKTIFSVQDLASVTPGVSFTASGASYNVTLTIRGQTRAVTGPGLPSVLTYFNEVPLPANGSNIPTFDMSSVQVLKGPQGTLFGRNTTGGLLLTYSAPAVYDFSGYVQGSYGNYNDRRFEGAINVPVIDNGLAIRLSGEVARHDGYTKNESGGPDFDNLHRNSLRGTIRADPFDWLSNVTVFDYFKEADTGASATPVSRNDPSLGTELPFLAPDFNCGYSPDCDADLALARALKEGPRHEYTDQAHPFQDITFWGVSNTTTLNFDPVTIKNIFGYRSSRIHVLLDVDGTDLPIITVSRNDPTEQFTDEAQIYGKLFGDKLDWRLGGFYLKSQFRGPSDLIQTAYGPDLGFTDLHNYYADESKAVFGNLTFDLGDWLSGLKLNLGGRYTIDKETVCSGEDATTGYDVFVIQTEDQCKTDPSTFSSSVTSKEPTYTFGLDWQATKDLFLYATKRRGYRGGGINSPLLGGSLVPYQFYKPEFINDYEIGVKTSWRVGGMTGRFNLSGYTGQYKDIQTVLSLPPGFDGDGNSADDPSNSAVTINRGAARIRGFDALAIVSPVPPLSFTVGAAYTDAKYTDLSVPAVFAGTGNTGSRFSNTPKWTWTANGRYEAGLGGDLGKIVFNVDYYHASTIYYLDLRAAPYHLWNARVDWEDAFHKGIDIAIYGRNLSNSTYVAGGDLGSTSLDLTTGHYGDPRTFGVQVSYRF